MKERRTDILPISCPPRGLSREDAAAYAGFSPSQFDKMVEAGRMPGPKVVDSSTFIWDARAIHEARYERAIVYVVRCGDYVKIGWTRHLRGRIAALQTAAPDVLVLCGALSGSRWDERQLHARFAEHRSHGEWFHLREDVADFVACLIYQSEERCG